MLLLALSTHRWASLDAVVADRHGSTSAGRRGRRFGPHGPIGALGPGVIRAVSPKPPPGGRALRRRRARFGSVATATGAATTRTTNRRRPKPQRFGRAASELLKGLDSAAHLHRAATRGSRASSSATSSKPVASTTLGDLRRLTVAEPQRWCAALAGYAAHSGQRFAAADSAFAVALSSMEPAERCRWLDPSNLMDGDLARRFEQLDCTGARVFRAPAVLARRAALLRERDRSLDRASRPRHTRADRRASATVDGESWADDVRELMTRYGWPRWYSRSMPEFGSQREPSITGHDSGMPYNYLPTLHALEHVGEMSAEDWKLDDPRALTGYAPSYARSMHDVPSQVARFRRGDSTLVVAAWDARRDTTLLGRRLDAALVVARPGEAGTIARMSDAKAVGHLAVTGLVDSGVVSLELLAKEDRRAARARVGVAPARLEGESRCPIFCSTRRRRPRQPSSSAVRDSALASSIVPASQSDRRVLGDVRAASAGRAGSLHADGRGDRGRVAAARRRATPVRRSDVGAARSMGRSAAAAKRNCRPRRARRSVATSRRPVSNAARDRHRRRRVGRRESRRHRAVAGANADSGSRTVAAAAHTLRSADSQSCRPSGRGGGKRDARRSAARSRFQTPPSRSSSPTCRSRL